MGEGEMAETKTKITQVDPAGFIAAVEPAAKRADAEVLDAMFRRVTGEAPQMWGPSIIGYGSYHYRYPSGHEGRSPRLGFSPRKARHSLYLLDCGDEEENAAFVPLLARLGKHSRSVACLYVNKLADIDLAVLEEMAALSWTRSFESWPES
jgi:hypothetical protein